ncbi:LacI family DNA-binding transcriptional regulator [Pseudooctadecabacter jejudonensis]|uniref:HTH-type transcriptional regulator RafR n=1 Tax=Pseudooctadecabacter jejudonensis TaxID=1391910 RepID=A0A1Y5SRF4_9RHOB|nr:LacI family DNA-binding transcriptional regulator [Pseudooctadecabacter jejudonensis]SLN44831.1 HTH-type transcriptional regulator RafR [Pseudooctadecabacter jejudonensis]
MSAGGRRPTLKTIAAETQLSTAAVSRILRGDKKFSEKTIQMVHESAARVGYIPNQAGVKLRTGRTGLIAFVFPSELSSEAMLGEMINSIASSLKGTDHRLTIYPTSSEDEQKSLVREIVDNRLADGVILNRVRPEDERVHFMMERGFPFIAHGRSDYAPQHDFVDFDNYEYARRAVCDLADAGCRDIKLLAPPMDQFYAVELMRGGLDAARERGIAFSSIQGVSFENGLGAIAAALTELCVAGACPDGLVLPSGRICYFVLRTLQKGGVFTGRNIHLATKDSPESGYEFDDAIFVYSEDAWHAGANLATGLLRRINDSKAPLFQVLDQPVPAHRKIASAVLSPQDALGEHSAPLA